MFESLDKMVEIENNELFTLDPFAYTKLIKNKNHIDNYELNSVILPVCIEIVCSFNPFNKIHFNIVLYFFKKVNCLVFLIILMFC